MRSWFHALVERILPWYDPAETAKHKVRSDALINSSKVVRRQSTVTRRNALRVRGAYLESARRLGRK